MLRIRTAVLFILSGLPLLAVAKFSPTDTLSNGSRSLNIEDTVSGRLSFPESNSFAMDPILPPTDLLHVYMAESSVSLWNSYEQEIADSCVVIDAAIVQLKELTNPSGLQTLADSLALFGELNTLSFLNNRSYRLHAVLDNLQRMRTSSIKYRVVKTTGFEGWTAYDKTTGEIVFYVVSTASFVHETAHGGQFEDRKIAYLKRTGAPFGNDVQDEIEAYCWQFAFDPASVISLKSASVACSFAGITKEWVEHLRLPDGSMPYSNNGSAQLARRTVTVDSDRKTVIRAYSFLKQIKQLPASWKITEDPNMFYK